MEKKKEWSPEMLSDSLLSNSEGKSLKDHLQETWELAKGLAERNRVPVDMENLKWVCWTHDLGKMQKKFQRCMQIKDGGVLHEELSAWFTLSATHDFICAEAVRGHRFCTSDYYAFQNFWRRKVFLGNNAVTADDINSLTRRFIPNWPYLISENEWKNLSSTFLRKQDQTTTIRMEEKNWMRESGLRLKTIYSLLARADYMSNMGLYKVSRGNVPEFKPFALDGACADRKARQACLEQAEKVTAPAPGIYSLIVSTKLGRTAIGLEIAGKWAHTMGLSNIVYVLPDERISDQTIQIISSAFGSNNVQYDFSGDVKLSSNPSSPSSPFDNFLRRLEHIYPYWDAPVVVTSAKQFMRALRGNITGEVMNFHRLCNAVVVMDNPQKMNVEEVEDFGTTIDFVSQKLNSVFLLSSYMGSSIMDVAKLVIAPPDPALLPFMV